ncbi:GNAT family N-acetyltransferase [Flagellimonas pacifica]|uniref:Ribosomal protein S18 acetylase RimI n=1 Tax=Flagellimonas pacifica TaxID=1247520 RepID=A0A285MSS9_9FLAO|nr:GNAT family N-acetyltransferase [Allomuricauda parva]SNZ00240.1 Ribosomal protein S18 acetylase RimI [Allomuricauda parva]
MNIYFEPVSLSTIETYIEIGKRSYYEHYLHLWKNDDPHAYINRSFTIPIVEKELSDSNVALFLVKTEDIVIGIVKLIVDCELDEFPSKTSLLAEKIYLLNAHSGKGFGKMVLSNIDVYAHKLGKKVVWLDTMQKGGPINFYLKNGFRIKKESKLSLSGAIPSKQAMWVLIKEL